MSPLLQNLIDNVYTLTNRPDLVAETLYAIKNSTLKAHTSDFYFKDVYDSGVKFDFENTQQEFEFKTLVPRWRSLKYVRLSDENKRQGPFLDIITPESILDSYSINKENVCYVAGSLLKIRTYPASQYFIIGCYAYPDVGNDTFDSWIAEEIPAVIVYQATAVVFKTIGYDEQNAAYAQLVKDEYVLLKQNNIVANGY